MVRPQDRKFVSADPEKCIGCLVCEYACSMTNEKTFNRRSREFERCA